MTNARTLTKTLPRHSTMMGIRPVVGRSRGMHDWENPVAGQKLKEALSSGEGEKLAVFKHSGYKTYYYAVRWRMAPF